MKTCFVCTSRLPVSAALCCGCGLAAALSLGNSGPWPHIIDIAAPAHRLISCACACRAALGFILITVRPAKLHRSETTKPEGARSHGSLPLVAPPPFAAAPVSKAHDGQRQSPIANATPEWMVAKRSPTAPGGTAKRDLPGACPVSAPTSAPQSRPRFAPESVAAARPLTTLGDKSRRYTVSVRTRTMQSHQRFAPESVAVA